LNREKGKKMYTRTLTKVDFFYRNSDGRRERQRGGERERRS